MRRAAELLSDLKIRGFTTEEIRESSNRVGFRIETFDGSRAVLAHVKIRSPHRVGKYGVDLGALDRIAAKELSLCSVPAEVVFIDEIGRMETVSSRFVETVESLLNSSATLVATTASRHPALDRQPHQPRSDACRDRRVGAPQIVYFAATIFAMTFGSSGSNPTFASRGTSSRNLGYMR
jgi:nucleoside-triphosphatase